MAKHITDSPPSDWSYKVFGCRCDACSEAHAKAMREYRERKREKDDSK